MSATYRDKKAHINPDLEEELISELEGQRNFKSGKLYWLIAIIAFSWSLFQLYASYYPINSTIVRSIHLSFGIILAYLIYPAKKTKENLQTIRWYDYILAIIGGLAIAYIAIDYVGISNRPGDYLERDIIVAVIGTIFLLEASRRVLGLALGIVAITFLAYD